jgi:RNA polymerase sigma factor (sigma-70 family)
VSEPATVEGLAPLVGIIARERTRERPDLYDDARQEGMIRAWVVLECRPDAPPAYVAAAARRAVNDVVRGRPPFGAESHRGRQDAHDTAGPLTRESADGAEYLVADPEDLAAADALTASEVAEAVREAVTDLDAEDRAVVFGRYWLDQGFAEIAETLGRPAGTLSRRWTEKIRPRLRADLAHLAA